VSAARAAEPILVARDRMRRCLARVTRPGDPPDDGSKSCDINNWLGFQNIWFAFPALVSVGQQMAAADCGCTSGSGYLNHRALRRPLRHRFTLLASRQAKNGPGAARPEAQLRVVQPEIGSNCTDDW
jgi:hypothetical protein